jgi:hypothetical protein
LRIAVQRHLAAYGPASDPGALVRCFGIRYRQGHRHVQVIRTAGKCAIEDRHHEPWVHSVQDMGVPVLMTKGRDVVRPGGVDPGSDEALVPTERRHGAACSIGVVVGHDQAFEEGAADGDRDDRAANPARTDDENPHRRMLRLRFWRTSTGTCRCSSA